MKNLFSRISFYIYFFFISLLFIGCASRVDKRIKEEKLIDPNIKNEKIIDKMMGEEVEKMKKDGDTDMIPEYLKRQYSATLDINEFYSNESIAKYRKNFFVKKKQIKKPKKSHDIRYR